MNRICVPYPIEILLKILATIAILIIDAVSLLFLPFKHMGKWFFITYAVLSGVISIYTCIKFNLFFLLAPIIFTGLFVLLFVATILADYADRCLGRIGCYLMNEIIFAPVCIMFRRPVSRKHMRSYRDLNK